MIEHFCKENLEQINRLLSKLSSKEYTTPLVTLSGSTIGQHVRHIAEFYLCLIKGMSKGEVNYDSRERDLRIEEDLRFTGYTLDKIRTNLPCGMADFNMLLSGNFAPCDSESLKIPTSFYRELAYCLEHSIHHQALIKVGLQELNRVSLIDEQFGVAPATIRFRVAEVK